MNGKQKIEAISKKMSDLQKEMQSLGKGAVCEAIAEVLAENPLIESVRWEQYAPGFNDGDPCVFSVHEAYVRLDADSEDGDNGDGYLSAWDIEYANKDESGAYPKDAADQAGAVSDFISNIPRDLMETAFGSSNQITIGRDGSVENDYYDCGY